MFLFLASLWSFRNIPMQDTELVPATWSRVCVVAGTRVALRPSPSWRQRHMAKSHAIVHAAGHPEHPSTVRALRNHF